MMALHLCSETLSIQYCSSLLYTLYIYTSTTRSTYYDAQRLERPPTANAQACTSTSAARAAGVTLVVNLLAARIRASYLMKTNGAGMNRIANPPNIELAPPSPRCLNMACAKSGNAPAKQDRHRSFSEYTADWWSR